MGLFKSKADKAKKKQKEKLVIPKTVQQSIPYVAVYEDSGIIEIKPGVFSKSFSLKDINYQIAKQIDQDEMFISYGTLLNMFDSVTDCQVTVFTRNIDDAQFKESTLYQLNYDSFDELRIEMNNMINKRMREGKNNRVVEKYLTISMQADSYDNVVSSFSRLESEIRSNVKKIGGSEATPLTTAERLCILHDIYNIGHEGEFGTKVSKFNGDLAAFSFKDMVKQGLTTKDVIGPNSMEFKSDYMKVGDKYARALYLKNIATILPDNFLAELTDIDCNMLTSINFRSVRPDEALKAISRQIVGVNSNVIDRQKKASKSGYAFDLISPELSEHREEMLELRRNITSQNQKLFITNLVIVHFADELDKLDEDTEAIFTVARKFMCRIDKLVWQQELGLASALPLANNKLKIQRKLTTESLAVFMPFVNQELKQQNGFYYGQNAISHNLIFYDRLSGQNYNGFIFGTPGSGKSFSAKQEIINSLLKKTNSEVIVIDPEAEYSPMAQILGGQEIRIANGSNNCINPMDIDTSYDDDDPVSFKSDFIISLIESAFADRYGLNATQRSIIDRCCRSVYSDYFDKLGYEVKANDKSKMPTLMQFQEVLQNQPGYESQQLATSLEMFTKGSLDIFAHHTNVDYDKRFVVYNIKDVGKNLKSMAYLVVLDNCWQRIVRNRKKGINTYLFVDEAHILFRTETSVNYLREIYKRSRKYGAVITCITQNVADLLENDTARTMISNSEYIQLLRQAPLDKFQLAELLNISDTQLSFITNSGAGEGLMYTREGIIPFINKFDSDTKLYKAMTTKLSDIIEDKRTEEDYDI